MLLHSLTSRSSSTVRDSFNRYLGITYIHVRLLQMQSQVSTKMRCVLGASFLSFVAISIILLVAEVSHLEAKTVCITQEDGSEDYGSVELWRRQRASLLFKWFIVDDPSDQTNGTSDPITNIVNLFNRTIGSAIPFEMSTTGLQDLTYTHDIRSVDTNITLIDESNLDSSVLLSQRVALVLLKLLDCSLSCNKLHRNSNLHKPNYQVHLKNKLSWSDESMTIEHLNPIIVSFNLEQLNQDDSESKNDHRPGCGLCEQVKAAGAVGDQQRQEEPLTDKIWRVVKKVVLFLEPHHWLALFLGVWLTVCLIIAMLIKSRDKRRLRLYLEERADYSFSAKR